MKSLTYLNGRSALTLLEVMLAMVLSLFVMLALARAFKLIGDRITSSQSELDLSSNLREIASNLREELGNAEFNPAPPAGAGEGYLVYYEGPMTDSTTSLVAQSNFQTADYIPNSRYGDIDDYLAFTASSNENLFMGYLPRGILAAHEFLEGRKRNPNYVVANYDLNAATELVPFYSDRAEIAYWLSPRWETVPFQEDDPATPEDESEPAGILQYDAVTGTPIFRDADQDLLPDSLDLHRRVLLIRDDLNIRPADIDTANNNTTNFDNSIPTNDGLIPFLVPGSQRIVPLSNQLGASPDFYGTGSTVNEPGVWQSGINSIDPSWLLGLARVQQVMDLSISRINNDWATPNNWNIVPPGPDAELIAGTPVDAVQTNPNSLFGSPTPMLRANGMQDITRPENRFAHVRMPEQLLSSTAGNIPPYGRGSTMPLLALTPPQPFLVAAQNHDSTGRFNLPTQADPSFGSYGRFTLTGFLRPEFNLTDRFTLGTRNANSLIAKQLRGGSDVIASNVLSFDVKIFDDQAPAFVWLGPDGEEGHAVNPDPNINDPFDDDRNGIPNDLSELGWPNTDDEIVLLGDLQSRDALIDRAQNPTIESPEFVDLGFLRLPGHALGGTPGLTRNTVVNSNTLTPLSGVVAVPPNNVLGFPKSTQQSGRFAIKQNAGNELVSSFFQPVFDTWTLAYRNSDNFDQEGKIGALHRLGAPAPPPPPNPPPNWPPGRPFPPGGWPPPGQAKTRNNNWTPTYITDFAANDGRVTYNGIPTLTYGIGRDGSPTELIPVSYRNWSNMSVASQGGNFQDNGSLDLRGYLPRGPSRIDPRPPIEQPLRAIQIQIRLFDSKAGQIRQQTIIETF